MSFNDIQNIGSIRNTQELYASLNYFMFVVDIDQKTSKCVENRTLERERERDVVRDGFNVSTRQQSVE